MFDFKQAFDDYVSSTDKVWGHDRTETLGSSEVFGCLRKAWFKRNCAAIDDDYEDRWGATRRGDIIENELFAPALKRYADALGARLLFAGDEQQTLFCTDAPLSTTPDGLIDSVGIDALEAYGVSDLTDGLPLPEGADEFAGHCFTVECKSIDPRTNLHGEEKETHAGQVNTQIGAIRECTAWKPSYGVIIYFDASFLDDIQIFVVKFDPQKYEIAKARARQVYATTDAASLVREGTFDDSCDKCQYNHACAMVSAAAYPKGEKPKRGAVSSPELAERLEPLARAQQSAKFRQKEAEREAAEHTEAIKLLLREHGVPWGKGEGWSVSYTLQDGRESVDKSALEADGIDLAKYTKQGDPFEVLRVTVKDGVRAQ